MPNPVYVQPDPVLALLQYLRLRPELITVTTYLDPVSHLWVPLIAADHLVTEIPASPTYPYGVVQLGGGNGIWPGLDEPALQVDTVGGTKFLCGLIARTIRACIWAIANDTVPAGVLASGSDEMGPAYIPDMTPTPPLPRYTARYRVLLHP